MCGIAGAYGSSDAGMLRRMTDAIAHRGPDGEYHYSDGPVLLGNRRLAIQDVAHGDQPMFAGDGRVAVVYNGEIYNYPQLREELLAAGVALETHCDTEVIPHLYLRHGPDFAARLNGMFAIALWDRQEQALYLYRDPIGVKPLVIGQAGDKVVFGSEVKALIASGLIAPSLDETALHYTMNLRYIPGERTMFAGVRRVDPGTFVRIADGGRIDTHRYADISWEDIQRSDAEWLEGIPAKLGEAVNRQLISDVPLGFSLSGGIDSSALVALVAATGRPDLATFTLGFNEPTDENADAARVAERYGTTHRDTVLHEPAMASLADAVFYTEEPKVNCLQLYLLHRYLSDHVKVVLSGLGGDELFAGYDFYGYLFRSERFFGRLPAGMFDSFAAPLLGRLSDMVTALDAPQVDLFARGLDWLAGIHDGPRHYLALRNGWERNQAMIDRVYTPDFAARVSRGLEGEFADYFTTDSIPEGALHAEFRTKMVNDLLHNEDTMSMAHSVESRVPWLDLDFVRYVAQIPAATRFRGGMKGFLKEALTGVLPDEVLYKKKWGFTVNPVEQFRKDLEPLARSMLLGERFLDRGVFRREFVSGVLDARPGPRLRWHYFMLWQMIGFEHWCRHFLDGERLPARA